MNRATHLIWQCEQIKAATGHEVKRIIVATEQGKAKMEAVLAEVQSKGYMLEAKVVFAIPESKPCPIYFNEASIIDQMYQSTGEHHD